MEMTPALHIWDRVGGSGSEVEGGGVGVGGWVGGGVAGWWVQGWVVLNGQLARKKIARTCVRSITHCDSVVGIFSC